MFHEAMELNCAYNVGQMRFVELGPSKSGSTKSGSTNWVRQTGPGKFC
jgi:hypothetical protein